VRHREPIGDLRCPGKLLDESLQSGHRYSPFTPTAESISIREAVVALRASGVGALHFRSSGGKSNHWILESG